jgi:hypothetical protein
MGEYKCMCISICYMCICYMLYVIIDGNPPSKRGAPGYGDVFHMCVCVYMCVYVCVWMCYLVGHGV